MMAVRERAVKVMAALDRRVPSLDDLVGQSWTAWAEWAGVAAAAVSDVEDCSKNGKKDAGAMSLSKEDMSMFGLYPGHDDFYLVVCSHCGQVVKPQAFEKHCERRHGPLSKLYARLRSPAPQQRPPHHSHSPSHGTNASASAWEGLKPRAAPPSPSTPPQHRHSKNPKDGIRHSPVEKSSHTEPSVFKQPPLAEPALSSPAPSLRDPPWPHGAPPPARASPTERPPAQGQRKDSPLASAAHRVPRTYNKVASKRECDLDKHCGVLDPDRKKVCTRLLTCNIHSIHQRRKVCGRSRNFDQLVAELKTKVREKGSQSADGRSPSPEAPRDQPGAPHCRRPLASLPAFRATAVSGSAPEEEQQEEGRAASPLVHGKLSSDDSEPEGPDEPVDFSSSAAHPKPLAVCSFGSHALGHGIYTFDRRLHHLRSALSNMLEQHISAHLWRKIPQATDLQCPPPSAKAASFSSPSSSSSHSKGRTGSPISCSPKTSTSSSSRGPGRPDGPSENSGGVAGGPSPSQSRPAGVRSGRTRNPVGRPSKHTLKLREEAAAAAALRKRKAPSQESEHSGPDRNCITLQDRGRPPSAAPSPLPHSQTNGTLSPGSKPRPQPSPSEAKALWTYRQTHDPPNATVNSGLHGAVSGRTFEHSGVLVKRRKEEHSKASGHRPPPSSSSTSSSFYSWKESKGGGGLAGGVDKKLGAQKPKLHH